MQRDSENMFLTPNQAAEVLNISLTTMKKLIYQGQIKTFKTPGGHHRILKSDLLAGYKHRDPVAEAEPGRNEGEDPLLDSIRAFSAIIENRQKFCRGHAVAVAEISAGIAQTLDLPAADVDRIRKASLLHDIGLIAIAEEIINRDAPLARDDYDAIKNHPSLGADILGSFSIFADIAVIVRQHHERPDGAGYPDGLTGRNICLEARIIAVAECFDSMTSADSYKKSLDPADAAAQIKEGSGTQFDPAVVRGFWEYRLKQGQDYSK